jgi:hypothetical protein
MRTWNRRVKYEDRNRAAGLCVRSKRHGRRDVRSKNLCAPCLRHAREMMRDLRRPGLALVKKPVQRAQECRRAA